jgi:DNA-binding transcriptional regulator YdaS (Cro superfamily)
MLKPSLKELLKDRGLRLADLARLAGVDKGTATRWDQGRIPAERVLDIEQMTGVSRSDLRPDLYPLRSRSPASQRPAQ